MRLGPKITIFASITNVIALVFVYFVFQSVLISGLNSLEVKKLQTNLDRVKESINQDLNRLEGVSADYSNWDDTYLYVLGKNQNYLKSNFIDRSFEDLDVDLVSIYDKKRNQLFSKGFDSDLKIEIPFPLDTSNKSLSIAFDNALSGSSSKVLVETNYGFVMIVVSPVKQSSAEGPVAGALLIGKFLDESFITSTSRYLKISFRILGLEPLKNEYLGVANELKSGVLYSVKKTSTKEPIYGYSQYSGINGEPLFLIEVFQDRELSGEGERATRFLIASLMVSGVISMGVLILFFNWVAVSRLGKLEKGIKKIRSLGNFSQRVTVDGYDEIGILSRDINDMLGSLEISQRLLLEEEEQIKRKVEEQTKEIREAEAKLFASINSVPNGLIITDREQNLVLVNQATSKILNLKDIPLSLSSLQKVFGESLKLVEHFDKCIDTQRPFAIDDVGYGSKFLHVYLAPIYFLGDRKNHIIGVVILITDITEPKLIEKSKDEFFSIASHELRTPLTAIRGNTDLIKKFYGNKFPDDASFKEMISDINEASLRLIGIVNEFLTTSRLELGKISFSKEGFDIDEIVESVIKEFSTPATAKGLSLNKIRLSDPLPKVLADKDRVREVLVNLVSNAIKYSEKGRIDIKLKWDGDFLSTSVEDTGKGVPVESQNFLFRKFQQAKRDIYARDTASSTGLGLYICKLLVENMGGEIFLAWSKEGVGSTFTFTLPLAPE